jgi:hypothetical protein
MRLKFERRRGGWEGRGGHLEAHDERLPLHVRKAHVEVADVSIRSLQVTRPVEHHLIHLGGDAMVQPPSQPGDVCFVVLHLLASHLAGRPQADDQGGGHGPAANTPLLHGFGQVGTLWGMWCYVLTRQQPGHQTGEHETSSLFCQEWGSSRQNPLLLHIRFCSA